MKKLNYPELVKKINQRANELNALSIAKSQETEIVRIPKRVNNKTIVLEKSRELSKSC